MTQETAIAIINNISEKLGIAIDTAKSDIIPYAQELLLRYSKYVIATNIFEMIFLLIISVVGIFLGYKLCIKGYEKNKNDDIEGDWVYSLTGIIFFILSAILFLTLLTGTPNNVRTIYKAIYIPEALVFDLLNNSK